MAIPAAFDPDFYLAHHPDLANFSHTQAEDHYATYGRKEGRVASPLALRDGLVRLARQAPSKLEIGPFHNPALVGDGVKYLDVLDSDQIRTRAASHGLDTRNVPARIDYVGGLEQVSERFDAVFSAHCIEHQPDLVAHLNAVSAILKPGGRYFLVVPDKRFCFDHFIAESTVADVVEAHIAQRRVHTVASVVEHMALTTHNDSVRHWHGDHGAEPSLDDTKLLNEAIRHFKQNEGAYIDTHAWQFTPDSFRRVVDVLFRIGMARLRAAVVCDTPVNMLEFCAVLE